MPHKKKIIGIYAISTPNGSTYVGSSNSIYRRWCEHKRLLKKGQHHSERLQAAWNKHEGNLTFSIIMECSIDDLEAMEQKCITEMGAELNTTSYVNNVWCNPETREKLAKAHSSNEWRLARSEIAKRVVAHKRVKVDCSDGRTFDSMHAAALAIGVRAAQIKAWCITQRESRRYGFRFKYASDSWRDVLPAYQQAALTRAANGYTKHSDETRAKMRAAKVGFVPHNKGAKHEAQSKTKMSQSQKRIELMDKSTGLFYASCLEASKKTGISRSQVRRLAQRSERFVVLRVVPPVSKRGIAA
jgi:predicted GIY-YIG superfamily endonuclease